MSDVVLNIVGITKKFGATLALSDANVTFKEGTVHSLVGRNGAGKSTLVNIIAGLYKQDAGQVLLHGRDISHLTVFERQQLGVRIVTQHASVIPHLDVAENIFMGLWPKNKNGLVNWKKMYEMAGVELKEYGLDVNPREKVFNLSPVDQRKVNIIRAMYGGAKLIILDEPTTSLSSEERDNLFGFIKRLTKSGTAFILITHYLEEVIKLSDEITVLRDGLAFTGYMKGSIDEEELANLITGEGVHLIKRIMPAPSDDIVLECKQIYGNNLKNVSFQLRRGEVLGIVGFPGSGAREICRAIYGLQKIEQGEIFVNGKKCLHSNPTAALKNGVAYIPNDRHTEGVIQQLSIRENICLPILRSLLKNNRFTIDLTKEKAAANKMFKQLNIKAISTEDKVGSLSGGNQQKVVVAKVLCCEPQVLILDEPTVGIDIKSREEILEIVNEMTKKGISAIYLTNDFDELLRITDRLFFFKDGEIIAQVENEGLTAENVINIRDSIKDGVK